MKVNLDTVRTIIKNLQNKHGDDPKTLIRALEAVHADVLSTLRFIKVEELSALFLEAKADAETQVVNIKLNEYACGLRDPLEDNVNTQQGRVTMTGGSPSYQTLEYIEKEKMRIMQEMEIQRTQLDLERKGLLNGLQSKFLKGISK